MALREVTKKSLLTDKYSWKLEDCANFNLSNSEYIYYPSAFCKNKD